MKCDDRNAARLRARYQRLRAAHRCVTCERPTDALHAYCPDCRVDVNARRRACEQRQKGKAA